MTGHPLLAELASRGERVRAGLERKAAATLRALLRRVVEASLTAIDLTELVRAHVDLDALAAGIDVDAVIARADVDAVIARTDLDAIVSQVDLDAIVRRIDIEAIVRSIDLDAIVSQVDLDAIVRRIDIEAIVRSIDLDAIVSQVDLDAIVRRIDIEAIVRSIDLDAIVDLVDLDRVASHIDLDAIVQRVEVDAVVARVDVEAVLDRWTWPGSPVRSSTPSICRESSVSRPERCRRRRLGSSAPRGCTPTSRWPASSTGCSAARTHKAREPLTAGAAPPAVRASPESSDAAAPGRTP